MEILSIIYAVFVTYYAVDTKLELNELEDQPPRIVKQIKIQRVEIPVAMECPKPKDIRPPELLVNSLTDGDYGDYDKVANAYVVSLNQCMSYATEQKVVLDGYRLPITDFQP